MCWLNTSYMFTHVIEIEIQVLAKKKDHAKECPVVIFITICQLTTII